MIDAITTLPGGLTGGKDSLYECEVYYWVPAPPVVSLAVYIFDGLCGFGSTDERKFAVSTQDTRGGDLGGADFDSYTINNLLYSVKDQQAKTCSAYAKCTAMFP